MVITPKQDQDQKSYDVGAMARRTVDVPLLQAFAYNAQNMVEYHGWAQPGTAKSEAGWRIAKLTYSGFNVTDIQFADGDVEFDNIWDNRESLSYS